MGCNGSKESTESVNDASKDVNKEVLGFVGNVSLFQRLPDVEQVALAKALQPGTHQSGTAIIKQGDDGNEFYVLKSGECKVEVDGAQIAKLSAGDYFGENALLRDEPRTATITATSQVESLWINRAKFEELGLHTKLDFPKRGAVAGGDAGHVDTKPPSPKTEAEKQLMLKALKANANLATIGALDDSAMNSMISLMWKETVAEGTTIIKQGDLNADYFYIVMEGLCQVQVSKQGQSLNARASSGMVSLSPGTSFGELSLMYFAPRAATIVAKEQSTVMIIDRLQFKKILLAAAQEASKKYIPYLDKVELLDALKVEEKTELAKALTEMNYKKGEQIFAQGDKGDNFYILIEGSVSITKDGKKVSDLRATTKDAQIFGELALLSNEVRSATIDVTSSEATALAVDKVSFDMLLGPLNELQKRGKTGTTAVRKVGPAAGTDNKRFGVIKRNDLKTIALLGCGGFGAVFMVQHTKSQDVYALKSLSKGYIVKSGMQCSVMSEKNVQLMCDSKFVVKLFETYNGDQSLYLLLELCQGGELYATYNKKNLWGNESCAKFYVAGATLAFEHLHEKKIIFRDLKPENLLLNEDGHIKLTDMGLAKVVVGKTYTTCGTPDYFAPELIASKGHTQAVDWWTLGVLTFELLSGHPPFESATPMQIYQKVTKGINRVMFTRKCKGNAELFIKALCTNNPSERLPMKKGGIDNIKDHAYYTGFDWSAFTNLTMKVPYKPTVKSKKDAGNFSARKEDIPPQIDYKPDKSGWDKDFATST